MNVDPSRAGAASGATPTRVPATTRADPPVAIPAPAAKAVPADPARNRPDRDDVSLDDLDIGWGESPPRSGRDDEWYRDERPPHHG